MNQGVIQKAAAVILMLLAALGLLICAAGMIAAIAANGPISNAVGETIAGVEGYFSAAEQTTARLQEHLASINEEVSRIRDQLNETEISDAAVLRAIAGRIERSGMGPSIERFVSTTQAVTDGLLAFNSMLVSVNRIPGVNLPTLSDELAALSARIEAPREDFQAIRNALSTSQNIKARLLQPLNRLSESLDRADQDLEQERSRMMEIQARLRSLRLTALRIIDLVTVACVLIFTLFSAGQVLLFERARKWFKSIPAGRSPEGPGLSEDSEGIIRTQDLKG